ncbi:MAG: hypothetical protein LBK01_04985, partial [Burkholderiaceae bacterium]|nr:hypothetical protein [Burkholderiaceae bacterium]
MIAAYAWRCQGSTVKNKEFDKTIAGHSFSKILACLLVSAMLGACVPVMFVGGGVTGTMAATDRRTLGTQADDKVLSFTAESRADAIVGKQGHVNATSFNKRVLLTGEVQNNNLKARV